MGKRPMLTAAVCALAALLLVLYASSGMLVLAAGAAGLQILLFVRVLTGKHIPFVWVPVIFLCFLLFWQHRMAGLDRVTETNARYEGQILQAAGRLVWMEEKNGRQYLYLEDVQNQQGERFGGMVLILEKKKLEADPLSQQIAWEGELSLFSEGTNPGQFDARSYYRSQGWYACMYDPQIAEVPAGKTSYGQQLYRFRRFLRGVMEEIAGEDAPVFSAMLLGDKTGLDAELKSLYQAGGISHILAISGLHMSLIGMGLYTLLRRCGLSFPLSACVCVFLMGSFTYLSGSGISAIRACLMLAVLLGAACAGRTYDLLSAAGLAWILLVMRYPYQIFQAGFQLSFGAVLALGMIAPVLQQWVKQGKEEGVQEKRMGLHRWREKMTQGVIASVSVQLMTVPVLAWHFCRISVMGLLLNLLVIPLMSVLMAVLLAGTGIGALGSLTANVGVWRLASAVLYPARLILRLYEQLCGLAGRLPGAVLTTGRPQIRQVALYYGLLLAVLLAVQAAGKRREETRVQTAPGGERRRERGKRGRNGLLLIGAAAASLLVVRVKDPGLTFVLLDVGQGDGIFLQTQQGLTVFLDGGSSSVSQVGTYRIRPLLQYYGVTQVDYWFLSHPDSDHINGFLEVAEAGDIRIGAVILSEASMGSAAWKETQAVCERQGIPVCGIAQGEYLSQGDFRLTCLYPEEQEEAEDPNELSQVLRLDYGGYSALFTGDIGEETEKLLLKRYEDTPWLLRCDFLKIAHHGSKYSTGEAFLLAADADYALISCGTNRYGHPAPETLARIRQAGMELHITWEEGAVILRLRQGG